MAITIASVYFSFVWKIIINRYSIKLNLNQNEKTDTGFTCERERNNQFDFDFKCQGMDLRIPYLSFHFIL